MRPFSDKTTMAVEGGGDNGGLLPKKQIEGGENGSIWGVMFGSCGTGVGEFVHMFSKCDQDTSAPSNQPNVVLFPPGGENRRSKSTCRSRGASAFLQQQSLRRSCEVAEIPELVGSDLGHRNGDGEISVSGGGTFHAFDDDISALSANTLEAMVATNHISMNLTKSEQAILNRRTRSNRSSASGKAGMGTESPFTADSSNAGGFPCASPTPTADSRYMYVKGYSPYYLEKTQSIRTPETIKSSGSMSSMADEVLLAGPRPEKEAPGAWI